MEHGTSHELSGVGASCAGDGSLRLSGRTGSCDLYLYEGPAGVFVSAEEDVKFEDHHRPLTMPEQDR